MAGAMTTHLGVDRCVLAWRIVFGPTLCTIISHDLCDMQAYQAISHPFAIAWRARWIVVSIDIMLVMLIT